MRKEIAIKSLCAVLGAALLFAPLTAFAAEPKATEKTEVLTYAQAIEIGVRKSAAYQSADLGHEQALEANKDLVVYYDTYIPALWQAKDDAKLAEKWTEKAMTLSKEQTANNIRNQMDNISLQLLEKKNLEEQIALKKEALRIAQAKYDKGALSSLELSVAQMDLKSQQQELVALEKKLEGDYIALYGALDLPVDTKRPLEYTVTFSAIGTVDLGSKYTQTASSDPYVWYKGEAIKSADYKLASYQYNSGGKNYALTKLDVTQARLNEQNTKRNLKLVIETRYNTLKQLEESLKSLDLKEQQGKLALQSAELKYKAGMGIALDVQTAQQTLKDLEYQRKKAQQSYMQAKAIFETPYLNPEYVAN